MHSFSEESCRYDVGGMHKHTGTAKGRWMQSEYRPPSFPFTFFIILNFSTVTGNCLKPRKCYHNQISTSCIQTPWRFHSGFQACCFDYGEIFFFSPPSTLCLGTPPFLDVFLLRIHTDKSL